MAKRTLKRVVSAAFNRWHWITLAKSFFIIKNPASYLIRYVSGMGFFPWIVAIRTPVGAVEVALKRFEDLYTINEIFIWEVYKTRGPCKFIDIGGNVGIASLYFLTRSEDSVGVLVEPLPENIARAAALLDRFGERIRLVNSAVAAEDGRLVIGVESTGRYSGVDCVGGEMLEFPALSVNTVLKEALESWERVNVVKIDCEGAEREFMPRINEEYLLSVDKFILESTPFSDNNLLAAGYTKRVVYKDGLGGVFEYVKKKTSLFGL